MSQAESKHLRSVSAKQLSVREISMQLHNASSTLTMCMMAIDSGDDIEPGLVSIFNDAMLQTAEGLAEAKSLKFEIDARVLKVEAEMARLKAYKAGLLHTEEILRRQVAQVVTAHPDVKFRDALGREVKVVNNGGLPALKHDIKEKSVSVDEISNEDREVLPGEFISTRTFFVLNKAAVRLALEQGRELSWARLVRSTRLNGL